MLRALPLQRSLHTQAQLHHKARLSILQPCRPRRSAACFHTRAMAEQQSGHSVPRGNVASAESEDPEVAAFQESQAAAPRLSLAEEARTLVATGTFGVISTLASGEPRGFPSGSVVEYAPDAAGRPIFSFSSLSPHTGDVRADDRCSLTVMAQGFRGLADARVNLIGRLQPLPESEVAAAKELYLARHPQSFWVNFGDFSWFKMEEVLAARLVGGFARAGRVSGDEYTVAAPDPVAAFAAPVCGHMNDDHADSIRAMVKHYAGISVDEARMVSLDRLGFNTACIRGGQPFKARLAFPKPADDRKAIKELIVEMTRAAAAAAAADAKVAA